MKIGVGTEEQGGTGNRLFKLRITSHQALPSPVLGRSFLHSSTGVKVSKRGDELVKWIDI